MGKTMLMLCALLLTADLQARSTPPPQLPPGTSGRIAKLIARSDGSSPERAFKVRSVKEEYELLAALGLRRSSQALVMAKGHQYDLLTATDSAGAQRKLWFEISSFF